MKTIIILFIILFNLQSFVKADDISDFEIEGISLGDSLLNFYSKEFIEQTLKDKKKTYYYKDKKYADLILSPIKKDPLSVVFNFFSVCWSKPTSGFLQEQFS